MKRNSLRHIVDAIAKAVEKSQGIGAIPAAERLYQFKIALIDSEPKIWRRIQVKNCTLDKLHAHKDGFTFRTMGVANNALVCPAVFWIVGQMKRRALG